uniref:Uncharacterized protein n=1 Tax=Cacopsylla melanoneura TaxID=428564 RepID=A0A8D8TF75_9HEMI
MKISSRVNFVTSTSLSIRNLLKSSIPKYLLVLFSIIIMFNRLRFSLSLLSISKSTLSAETESQSSNRKEVSKGSLVRIVLSLAVSSMDSAGSNLSFLVEVPILLEGTVIVCVCLLVSFIFI